MKQIVTVCCAEGDQTDEDKVKQIVTVCCAVGDEVIRQMRTK